MILEIDVGNTRLKWRLSSNKESIHRGADVPDEALYNVLKKQMQHAERIRIGSVGPDIVDNKLRKLCDNANKKTHWAKATANCCGVINSYSDPEALGVDRWLAMIAGYNQHERACCVIDCGSAITVDIVAPGGQHEGGYIVPGLHLLKKSLGSDTERVRFLPNSELKNTDFGKSTQEAVDHGVLSLITTWLDVLLVKSKKRYGSGMVTYITGGDGEFLSVYLSETVIVSPELVMDGLRYTDRFCEN